MSQSRKVPYYFNTQTGERSVELPLESPTSLNENGPPDRMRANMPEYTRPPPELMAGGMVQDEDEDSELTSASEAENESMMSSMGSLVSCYDSTGLALFILTRPLAAAPESPYLCR